METQLYEEYISMRLAHGDISNAISLLNRAKSESDLTIKAVVVRNCIIKYAKPFKVSYGVFQNKFRPLEKELVFPIGNSDHEELITERDKRIAHGDIAAYKPQLHYWSDQDIFPIVFRPSHLYDDIDTLINKMLTLCNIVLKYLNDHMIRLEALLREGIRC